MLLARAYDSIADPYNQYGYYPSLAAGGVFFALFTLLTLAHLALTAKSRVWWSVVMLVGGLMELLGWAGRIWAARNSDSHSAFIMQEVLLIIAPCFFSAFIYGATGLLIAVVGPEFSTMRPTLYFAFFSTADFVSIVIQAIGGGMASSDSRQTSLNGTHTMVGGIAFQLLSMIVYSLVSVHFLLRAMRSSAWASKTDIPGGRVRKLIAGVAAATILIIIRGVYRTVELAQGWRGFLITHEGYFIGFDGTLMVLCMIALVVGHPYLCLPPHLLVSMRVAKRGEDKETGADKDYVA